MQVQPLIAVQDVQASSRWYQDLLDCHSNHGGADYERLVVGDRLILQLHRWDAHSHPFLGDKSSRPYGNGVLLWFQLHDFEAAVARARALGAKILEDVHQNPRADQSELWLRDLDGYTVVLASYPHNEPARDLR